MPFPGTTACRLVVLAWLVPACSSRTSSGDVFAPVVDEKPAAPSTAAAETEHFDFEAEDRVDEPAGESPLTDADIAAGLGLAPAPAGGAPTPTPTPAPAAAPEVAAAPPAAIPTANTPWPPTSNPASWGVRLVSTVPDAQPPRAILGLADGSEAVVQPGTLLPEARVVVLAVGRDAVQIAKVTPDGDHATVETFVLTALYPGHSGSP